MVKIDSIYYCIKDSSWGDNMLLLDRFSINYITINRICTFQLFYHVYCCLCISWRNNWFQLFFVFQNYMWWWRRKRQSQSLQRMHSFCSMQRLHFLCVFWMRLMPFFRLYLPDLYRLYKECQSLSSYHHVPKCWYF